MKLFLGNGCLKSSTHVVKFGLLYAPGNLIRQEKGSISYRPTRVGQPSGNPLIDVILRGVLVWITPDVDRVRALVHPHVIDRHDGREGQVFKVDEPKVWRDSQVEDDILDIRKPPNQQRPEVGELDRICRTGG